MFIYKKVNLISMEGFDLFFVDFFVDFYMKVKYCYRRFFCFIFLGEKVIK